MMWLGDFRIAKTVRFMWQSNAVAGESITRATNGTISVYKDGGTTQSTTGVTDTEDFDALTGVHYCAIDTSADGTFYSAGSDFAAILSGATIDGKAINAVLAHFSLEARSALMPTTDGRKLDVSAGGEAGVDWANVGSPTTSLALTGTTIATTQKVDVETIKTQAVTCAAGVTVPATIASTTNITAGTITTVTNLTNSATSGDFTATMKTSIGTAVAASAVASVTGNVGGNVTGSVGSVVGAVGSVTGAVGSVTGAVGSVTGNVGGDVAGKVLGGGAGTITAVGAWALDGSGAALATAANLATVAGYVDTEVASILAAVDTEVAAIKAKTDQLTFTVANQVDSNALTGGGGLDAAGVRAAVGLASANLDTQLTAIDDYLDTEVAAIKAKTDNLPASPAATGDAMTLTSGERDSIAAALLDLASAIETGITPRGAIRLMLASLAGKLSGAATATVTIRNVGDSKDRITATVDADGNRTAVTTDAT